MNWLGAAAVAGSLALMATCQPKIERRQRESLTRACLCRCERVDDVWFFPRVTYPGVFKSSETVHLAWGGGAWVCMPGEDEPERRIKQIQDDVDLVNRKQVEQ